MPRWPANDATGVVPTAGLPPRPIRTDWRWRWPDDSVVAAKSHWTPIARRLWQELRIRYPATFDAVEVTPVLVETDGPDQITGVRFQVALYPDLFTLVYEIPRVGYVSDAYLDRLGPMVEAAHRSIRSKKWMLLEPIQPRCPYRMLWWHPDALVERLKAQPNIVLGPAMYSDSR